MKKIISILMMFIILTISCFSTTMVSFASDNMEMGSEMSMTMEGNSSMNLSDCGDDMGLECDDSMHECCISPFSDSLFISGINTYNNNEKKFKGKVFDTDFLAIIQESLEYNYIEKLTSPPYSISIDEETNIYISLIGIIKSNC